jgi:PhnB protein
MVASKARDDMAKVKAVPDGYGTVTPFLNIKDAAQAIDFYKRAFGAEELNRFTTPAGHIAIAILKIGTSLVRISDAVKEAETQSTLHLYVDDVDRWWKRAIDAGCQEVFPLQNMFFGDRFGIVKDRFGNRWSIATRVEEVSEAELRKRAAEMANVR